MRLHNETNYDIRILQNKRIGNMEAIDRVCREHNLRYYLWAGTMLGAVRHKGFIPWDDDMDICMPRPDYEKLIAHWREWLPQPYEVISTETDATYPYPFAKASFIKSHSYEYIYKKRFDIGINIDENLEESSSESENSNEEIENITEQNTTNE